MRLLLTWMRSRPKSGPLFVQDCLNRETDLLAKQEANARQRYAPPGAFCVCGNWVSHRLAGFPGRIVR